LTESTDEALALFPHPIGFSQTMVLAWRAFRKRFNALATVFCSFYTLACLIPLLLAFDINADFRIAVAIVVYIIAPATFGALANIIAAPVVADHFVDIPTTLREAIRPIARRIRSIWGILMLNAALSLMVALTLRLSAVLLIPLFYGPFIYTPYLAGPPVLAQVAAIETVNFRSAIRRFTAVVRGSGLRVFLYLLTPALVIGMVTFFALVLLIQSTPESPGFAALYLFAALQGIFMGLGAAFLSCVQTVSYLGLRAEKEGLDHDAFLEEREAIRRTASDPTQD
jgi:hypothetical protein